MKGNLFVISAQSGTGKTTVINKVLKNNPLLKLSISATTRPPRKNEKNGVDYHFVTQKEFDEMNDSGELLESAVVHSHSYGTPKGPIKTWLKEGKDIILDIDVQGAKKVKGIFKDAKLIFLMPPSRDELVARLNKRGTNKGDDLAIRIKNAEKEMAQKDFYNYCVINDDLDKAVSEVLKIINDKA